MRFAVVVFACVLAAATAQFNQGQYVPNGQYNPFSRYNNQNNKYNRYNPYGQYNRNQNYNQNYNPYKPYVSTTVAPRPSVFAEAKATVAPAPVVPSVTIAPVVVPAPTPLPVVPVVPVAKYAADSRSAETVRYGNEINPDGAYNYFYETNNGIAVQAQGTPRDFGGNPPVVPVVSQGSYSYTAPEGEVITITYVADENGYQPSGNAIPQPPEIPPQIARALEYIARNAPVVKSTN